MLSRARHAGYKGERIYSSYSLLILALDRVRVSAMPRQRFTTGIDPGTRWIGSWVSLRAGLVTEARGKIYAPAEGRTPVIQSVVRIYMTELPKLFK
jgi:hypothetical protein